MHLFDKHWRKNVITPRKLDGYVKKVRELWWGDIGMLLLFIFLAIFFISMMIQVLWGISPWK
jgi:hypothetical protein